jgi:hypothetical protein
MGIAIDKHIMQKAAETFTNDEVMTLDLPSKALRLAVAYRLPDQFKKILSKLFPPTVLNILPPFVGTMIRVSGKGVSLPNSLKIRKGLDSNVDLLKFIDVVSYAAAILIKNHLSNPSIEEREQFENSLTFADLENITISTLTFNDLTSIYAAYGLKREIPAIQLAMKAFKPKELPTLAESLPHYNIGSALKYFKGSMTENDIKWSVTWSNYMLYIASIPESPEETEKYKGIEVKDADEIF